MLLPKKILILGLSLYLAPSAFALPADAPKPKKTYYNPYYLLAARTALNAAGMALSCIGLEKCATESTRTAVDLVQIGSIVYWCCQQSKAYSKYQNEKNVWHTIGKLNQAIARYNAYLAGNSIK